MPEHTLYILVNKDLSMGKGKAVSQGGHAVHHIVHNILMNHAKDPDNKIIKKYHQKYMDWTNGHSKIITLNVPYADIQKLLKEMDESYPYEMIHDAGRTQVDPGSMTCLGFYPSDELTEIMRPFKLL
jgi:peptidyl-tRNA hydrolase, PTH2 family